MMKFRLFFSANSSKIRSLSWLKYDYVQKAYGGRPIIIRQHTLNLCVNCEDVSRLFKDAIQNIAITPEPPGVTAQASGCTPLFNNMTKLRRVDSTFKNALFADYNNKNLDPNHIGIQTWEPFEGLRNLEFITYLHTKNNIPKLFKIDFGTETGFKNVGGMFEGCDFDFNIPYDYFNSMKKIVNDDITGNFGLWYLFSSTKVSSLIDKNTGKMFMTDWNPEVPEDTNIMFSGTFASSYGTVSAIPSEQRVEFINSLCIIKDKTYNKLNMNNTRIIASPDHTGSVDVTPYLKDGKLLNITANIKELVLDNFNNSVPISNIPKGAIVLPSTLTKLSITDMFENCTAAQDVTDISEVFVYNGSLQVDWSLSGLKLYKEDIS